jgi:hypothetical protein
MHNVNATLADQLMLSARQLAECRERELALEDERPVMKVAAIQRLMQGVNPTNGKPHSASSAESMVELDEDYAAYRAKQRQAVVNTIMARARYEAALYAVRADTMQEAA